MRLKDEVVTQARPARQAGRRLSHVLDVRHGSPRHDGDPVGPGFRWGSFLQVGQML